MKKPVDSKVGLMLSVTFEVQFTGEAITDYRKLDTNMERRVNVALDALAQNPLFGPNITKLHGRYAGLYRYRVGRYRIIYRVDVQQRECIIRGIRPRGKAYNP